MQQALEHAAFYRFVHLDDPHAVARWLRELTAPLAGSILLATEGINGMVAAPVVALDAFEAALVADRRFAGIDFKRSACETIPFRRMKVRVKPEIVPLGIAGVDATGPHGTQVSPAAWRELIARDDVVVLDNRNSFEYRLGRFKGAIDPGVAHFRDFPAYVEAQAANWRAQGKRVAMYCTGGIRCEKTAAWMHAQGMEVFQLEGGILNYFRAMPDAEHDWEGECFVFDNRIALDTRLRETAATLEQVYADEPDGEWRIARARRLDEAA